MWPVGDRDRKKGKIKSTHDLEINGAVD
uniref:Uncharacterized protein n=1 Tax=Arundo donax TaxID=35708 RepID=A0A0A9HH62_ARUDO